MCHKTTTREFRQLEKSLIVYKNVSSQRFTVFGKFVLPYSIIQNKWFSMYCGFIYKRGKLYSIDMDEIYSGIIAKIDSSLIDAICGVLKLPNLSISKGFHSYPTKDIARNALCRGTNYRTVKCVIPKGAWVNYGTENDERDSIVSNKIIVKRACFGRHGRSKYEGY